MARRNSSWNSFVFYLNLSVFSPSLSLSLLRSAFPFTIPQVGRYGNHHHWLRYRLTCIVMSLALEAELSRFLLDGTAAKSEKLMKTKPAVETSLSSLSGYYHVASI
jgi:hypothetical protein